MTDRLRSIFDKQRELIKHFHKIECQNSPYPDLSIPVDLQTHHGQARVRDSAGRISEEVAEAVQTLLGTQPDEHYHEEVADILCFLVELCLIAGLVDHDVTTLAEEEGDQLADIFTHARTVDFAYGVDPLIIWAPFLFDLWDWMHHLKAKAWKLNPKRTDIEAFRLYAPRVFMSFAVACHTTGITDEILYCAYAKKHQINVERVNAEFQ